MPTSTDLVTDLPADFEVFGQAVDTSLADLKGGTTGQVLKKNTNTDMDFVWAADSAGMTNPMTTTGDTIYSSSGSTPARLGIGSTGQVLTVAGGVPTWAAAGGGVPAFTLLNTGGTNLAGSASTTVSGISDKDYIMVLIQNASSATVNVQVTIKINGVTSGYNNLGPQIFADSTYNKDMIGYNNNYGGSRIQMGATSNNAGSIVAGGVFIQGGKNSGNKAFHVIGSGSSSSSSGQVMQNTMGISTQTAPVTNVTVTCESANFDNGKIYVWVAQF